MRRSHSGLFLLEMILVILFFALTAAVYVQLFAAAYQTGNRSRDLTQAVMISQNLAEAFYANGGDGDAMKKLFPEAYVVTGDADGTSAKGLYLCFDEQWNAAPVRFDNGRVEGAYLATLSVLERDGGFQEAEISVFRSSEKEKQEGSESFYTLELTRYAPGKEAE